MVRAGPSSMNRPTTWCTCCIFNLHCDVNVPNRTTVLFLKITRALEGTTHKYSDVHK